MIAAACGWCSRQIAKVPAPFVGDPDVWGHVGETGIGLTERACYVGGEWHDAAPADEIVIDAEVTSETGAFEPISISAPRAVDESAVVIVEPEP